MVIDFDKHRITVDGKRIKLTKRENDILQLLYRNKNNVVKYDNISEKIYHSRMDKYIFNSMKKQICLLKRKIKDYITIQNIEKTGYLIEEEQVKEHIEEENNNDEFSFYNTENVLPF